MDISNAVSEIRQSLEIVEHGGKYGRAKGIYTAGHHWVFAESIELVLTALLANWTNIDWHKPQKSETILERVTYKSWDVEVRRAAGRCISLFVAKDWLPVQLKCANPGQSGKRIYVTADTVLPPTIRCICIVSREGADLDQLFRHKKTCHIDPKTIRIHPALLSPAS